MPLRHISLVLLLALCPVAIFAQADYSNIVVKSDKSKLPAAKTKLAKAVIEKRLVGKWKFDGFRTEDGHKLDSIPFVTKALHWAKFKRDDMMFGADKTFMQVEKHLSKPRRDSVQAGVPMKMPVRTDTSSGTWRYNDTTRVIELTYLKISRSKETENGSRKAALYIHDITDKELWLIELFYVPKDQQGFTLAHYKKEDW